jgi:dienelactone hydrolase
VLGGFSQGGALALYAGLRHPVRLAGLISLSAYVIDPATLPAEAAAANRDVPIFMAHGSADDVVRYDWGDASRQLLERDGWPVAWHVYPMGHAAVAEEIAAMGGFIPHDGPRRLRTQRARAGPVARSMRRAISRCAPGRTGARRRAGSAARRSCPTARRARAASRRS